MSQPRGFGFNGFKYYTNICNPREVSTNFVVDSANGNGLGVRNVKSNGYIQNVFMHTTAPLAGSGNPNPAAGYILVKFNNNFNRYLGGFGGFISPVTGAALAATVAGNPFVIVVTGTTTLAQWQAAGLPPGIVPLVGVSFIATATGAIGGTGMVKVPGFTAIDHLEAIGDPNLSLNNSNIATNGGAEILLQCVAAGALATPADSTVIALQFMFDGSSVTVDGL